MNTRNLTPEERYELILECRRSGLTDYQWLEEHGIRKSTFYHWIAQFRENGYPDIPEPLHQRSTHKAQQQEVVKLNILPDLDRNAPSSITMQGMDPVIEIVSGHTVIRLTNGTDPQLLETVLNSLRGAL